MRGSGLGHLRVKKTPPLGLPDSANKNTGHRGESAFQKNTHNFSMCLHAPVQWCQAEAQGDSSVLCWLFPEMQRGAWGGEGADGLRVPVLRVFQQHARRTPGLYTSSGCLESSQAAQVNRSPHLSLWVPSRAGLGHVLFWALRPSPGKSLLQELPEQKPTEFSFLPASRGAKPGEWSPGHRGEPRLKPSADPAQPQEVLWALGSGGTTR